MGVSGENLVKHRLGQFYTINQKYAGGASKLESSSGATAISPVPMICSLISSVREDSNSLRISIFSALMYLSDVAACASAS